MMWTIIAILMWVAVGAGIALACVAARDAREDEEDE